MGDTEDMVDTVGMVGMVGPIAATMCPISRPRIPRALGVGAVRRRRQAVHGLRGNRIPLYIQTHHPNLPQRPSLPHNLPTSAYLAPTRQSKAYHTHPLTSSHFAFAHTSLYIYIYFLAISALFCCPHIPPLPYFSISPLSLSPLSGFVHHTWAPYTNANFVLFIRSCDFGTNRKQWGIQVWW